MKFDRHKGHWWGRYPFADMAARTIGMTPEAFLASHRLMYWTWANSKFPPDDTRLLARITGLSAKDFNAVRDEISTLWVPLDGHLFCEYLAAEQELAQKRADRSTKGHAARWGHESGSAPGADAKRNAKRNAVRNAKRDASYSNSNNTTYPPPSSAGFPPEAAGKKRKIGEEK